MSTYTLAIDTSGPYCAVALMHDGALLESTFEAMNKGQGERLMVLIEEVMARHSVSYGDLTAIGVGTGPGNFTGIRISVSAARGLALGLGIPAYGVTGFEQRAICQPELLYHCVPAPREHVYLMRDGQVSLVPASDLSTIPPEPTPAALAGAIAAAARSNWPQVIPPPTPCYVRAPDAAPARDAPPVILT